MGKTGKTNCQLLEHLNAPQARGDAGLVKDAEIYVYRCNIGGNAMQKMKLKRSSGDVSVLLLPVQVAWATWARFAQNAGVLFRSDGDLTAGTQLTTTLS